MGTLTKEQINSVLGPVDNVLAAEIASTNASESELREAFAWVNNDDALVNDFRPFPKGRVAELAGILEAQLKPDDEW